MGRKIVGRIKFILPLLAIGILLAGNAFAEDIPVFASRVGIDTLWVMIAAFMVFIMQAGFGMLEAGLIRTKNTCNILMNNFLDFCMASVGFFMFGYAIMFGTGNGFMGLSGWFLEGELGHGELPLYASWLFHAVFCGAAATIVAGGVAERMKFKAYLMYSFIISAAVYPFVGHWIWGGGWLANLGFSDFAGSTVVHAVGGTAALVGTMVLGPRIGKYNKDGSANAIEGHSMALASLGTLILWFAWFGFNPGSTLSVGDGSQIAHVAVTTNLAAVAGALSGMFFAWKMFGKPDLTMTMNGALAGLVAVTAPCAYIYPHEAMIIGAVGGIIVVLATIFLDKLHIDDPVGAVPVHMANGLWGSLAVGIFGHKALGLANDGLLNGGGFRQLGIQALGVFSAILFVAIVMTIVFKLIDKFVGLRVSREDELKGLDITQHGMESYAGFEIFTTK
ncbi:MAG: ammonium transporter [Candidatus Omnitrophica bacterium CG11_big_fil_rev_8_21_14_0_20_42_13]|uniref:Ammonium transporter n=1 Tax=Candidatus Ghiorseimicrobium undicola TaxID=1974746 RepID=A0A2H0LXW0_9BACT|nr:MAG: ammonium transporter [Candidatus Omnitrophica bacterium CG11_big_fil_rev_8_21_14_0_20_42_13]